MLPFGIGFAEMAVILIVAVLLFGRNLPEVAKSLGASYQQFRKGLSELQNSINVDLEDSQPTKKVEYYDSSNDIEEANESRFSPPPEEEELESSDR